MGTVLQWLMLVVAIGVGWALGYTARKEKSKDQDPTLPSNLKDRLKILFKTYSEEAIDSFVQSLEVSSETVGMHLSIGSHFRKNGEVEKAILVHQNLMSRPEVPKHFTEEVTFELAKDYMSAGLLDRAESLLLQLKASKAFGQKSLVLLMDIYQQEREWINALDVGRMIQLSKGKDVSVALSHYSCELAEEAISRDDYWEARDRLKEALGYDKCCVRANLLLADLHLKGKHYAEAVAVLRKIELQDGRFVTEAIPQLLECSLHLKSEEKFRRYLQGILAKKASTSVILGIAESFDRELGMKAAERFLIDSLADKPSLRGLDRLVDYQLAEAASNSDLRHLKIIKQVTTSMLKDKPVYQCVGCGFSGSQLHWQCPSCKQWGCVAPILGVEGE